jgi:putative transposase
LPRVDRSVAVEDGADDGLPAQVDPEFGLCQPVRFHQEAQHGALWEGRYKACLVDHDRHLLAACRYIDLNPVRAAIVAHPGAYRWSRFAGLTGQRHDPLLTPHSVMSQLGDPPGPGYARWCGETVDNDELARLRDATNHELAFGHDRFKAQIEAATSRRTSAAPRGRGAAGPRGRIAAG